MRNTLENIGIVVIAFIIFYLLNPKDNTDSKTERSGMRILTDDGTGCQYLVTGIFFTGLTPRMKEDGKQICINEN